MADRLSLHIVSHTHWDREWYMSFQRYRRRFVKLMDHLLDLFEKKAGYKYFMMDGQVAVLGDYLEIRPEKLEKIKKYVNEGRLLIGPWYTQPNEFMVGGEALIRNLMYGIRMAKEYGGVMNICYLPDAFGHISQLPQVVAGFGIKDVVAWRGIPCGSKTAFKWKGADGTESMLFYIYGNYAFADALPLCEEDYRECIDNTIFERQGLRKRINEIIEKLTERAVSPSLLIMNGGDHSFAQDDLPEVIDKANEIFTDSRAIHSTLASYIDEVKKYHEENKLHFNEYAGEMRDSAESLILSGSQSTRTRVKILSACMESMFEKWMEPFAAIAWAMGHPYPGAEIWKAWEYLLQNHAHDSMACSSIDPVYHQILTRFEYAGELGDDIVNESLQLICRQISSKSGATENNENLIAVFNPLNWERNEVITAAIDIPAAMGVSNPGLMDGEKEIPVVIHQVKKIEAMKYNPRRGYSEQIPVRRYELSFQTGNVPGNGYKAFKLVNAAAKNCPGKGLVKGYGIAENDYFLLEINQNGTLNIFDKVNNIQYKNLHYFEDSGEAGHGFDHEDPLKDTVVYSPDGHFTLSLLEDSMYRASFKIETSILLPAAIGPDRQERSHEKVKCPISSVITVYRSNPRMDIETEVCNLAVDHRLRVVFPTGINTKYCWVEQPFDVVRRKIELPDDSGSFIEKPSPTQPQLTFVDVSDGDKGLMIANEGLYEYEVTDDDSKAIALTLLRCTDIIHSSFGKIEDIKMPEAQCIGTHHYRYSIIPHRGTWENGYKEACGFRFPMRAVIKKALEDETLSNYYNNAAGIELPFEHSFVKLESDMIAVSSLKKCENNNSIIIRLQNLSGDANSTRCRLDVPKIKFSEAYKVNFNEERMEKLDMDDEGWVIICIHGKGLYTVEFVKQ